MGMAYVRFAVANPSHYRVMFGGFVVGTPDAALLTEATGAFQVLVDAIIWLQQHGLMRDDDPLQLAGYIWSVVHGIAMLVIDGQFGAQADAAMLTRFALERLRTGTDRRD
jgi:hypothetical protein